MFGDRDGLKRRLGAEAIPIDPSHFANQLLQELTVLAPERSELLQTVSSLDLQNLLLLLEPRIDLGLDFTDSVGANEAGGREVQRLKSNQLRNPMKSLEAPNRPILECDSQGRAI